MLFKDNWKAWNDGGCCSTLHSTRVPSSIPRLEPGSGTGSTRPCAQRLELRGGIPLKAATMLPGRVVDGRQEGPMRLPIQAGNFRQVERLTA
ncbi:hypothetical protein RN607_14300 [Demequina capsici]|uniref:Uncharacterized protein n=1 Tax=Demequina capsici TaxID=3075620 RepID=A0AA96FAV0_9MICO|nr:hypothetical protein [Demequina sp. PMTSA13]WNM27351.1 hypothetical protein RN607_14300 [Demequina sp. PMTSA13]